MKQKTWPYIFLLVIWIISIFFGFPNLTVQAGAEQSANDNSTTIQIWNRAQGPIVLQLTGPQKYSFTVNPNEKLSVQVVKGSYRYSYKTCGSEQSGQLSITKPTKFNTIQCVLVKVKVCNFTSGPFNLKLSGPSNYNFTINRGTNVIQVFQGKYQFSAQTNYCGGGEGGMTKKGVQTLSNGSRWPWGCRFVRRKYNC